MNEKKLMKMKELSEATSVSPGTIRYYIQEGLLPRPVKTHKNMAYYDESYIERIRTIKKLQQSRFLPLDVIRNLMEDLDVSKGDHLQIVKDIDKSTFVDFANGTDRDPMSREELLEHAGLTPEDLDAMEAIGLLEPDETGHYKKECIRIAEIGAEMRRIGLTIENGFRVEHLQLHAGMVEFLARKEVDLFTRCVADKGMDQEALNTMIRNAVNVINKLFPVLHFRMIRKISEELD